VAGFRSRTASHRASDADRRKRDGGRLSAAGEGVVLARPVEEEHAMVLAFFADGESWSRSALALCAWRQPAHRAAGARLVCGSGPRCGRLVAARARRRMIPPAPGFTTTLLLPAPLPTD
jgi:hypothetical protein